MFERFTDRAARGEAGLATAPAPAAPAVDELMGRLTSIATRLNAIEQRLRPSPPA
jgi:hypothetical protein